MAGLEWTLTLEDQNPILQPIESIMYKNRNENLNVRFIGYYPSTSNDEEVEEN